MSKGWSSCLEQDKCSNLAWTSADPPAGWPAGVTGSPGKCCNHETPSETQSFVFLMYQARPTPLAVKFVIWNIHKDLLPCSLVTKAHQYHVFFKFTWPKPLHLQTKGSGEGSVTPMWLASLQRFAKIFKFRVLWPGCSSSEASLPVGQGQREKCWQREGNDTNEKEQGAGGFNWSVLIWIWSCAVRGEG